MPVTLLTAVSVQLLCQLFKVVYYSIRDEKLSPGYFFSAGGIPSSHSAFVTSLTTAVGMRNGIDSEIFAVSFVFATIVTYDAFRLRGAVQLHAVTLNTLARKYFPEEKLRLNEMIGHDLVEIGSGIIFGGLFAAAVTAGFSALGF